MSDGKPKLPSELHPKYPKYEPITYTTLTGRDPVSRRWIGIHTVACDPTWNDRFVAFHAAHPEFSNEGEYEFLCVSCGNSVDTDHQYCQECDDHSGDWVYVNQDGEAEL